jgi:hypothetical protein
VSDETDEVVQAWEKFFQDLELARHYHLMATSSSPQARNPLLDQLLESQLFVALGSVLRDALAAYSLALGRAVPQGGRLHALIELLQDKLADPDAMHRVRDRRNALAHEPGVYASREEVDDAVNLVERELQAAALVGGRPEYEFTASTSQWEDSDDPDVISRRHHTVGLKRRGEWVVKEAFIVNLHRST